MTLRDRIARVKGWLVTAATVILLGATVSCTPESPAFSYGTTSRGVSVYSHGELRNPVDVEALSSIHDAMIGAFGTKYGIQSSWDYLDTFDLYLYDDPLSCAHQYGCNGLAHPSGTMEVVWRVMDRTELGNVDRDPFCPAFTATAHELYHLLLQRELGDIDGDHSGCWTPVQDIRNAVYDELCGMQP